MDVPLELLVLVNALMVGATFVFFARSLFDMLKVKAQTGLSFKFRRRYVMALVLAALTVTSVYGVTLFQHTFPTTPAGTQPVVSSTCSSLTLETVGMITGVSESMLFNCGSNASAITANSAGSSTPTFNLPSGANSLSLVAHVNGVSICTGGSILTSGTAHTFSSGDSLDYCLTSNSYPNSGIPSFTVTWSQ